MNVLAFSELINNSRTRPKIEELLNMKGGFPDVSSVVNYAIMYAFGQGEVRFLNEYLAERMNDEFAKFL